MRMILGLAVLALSGCMAVPAAGDGDISGAISYETTACFGTCPVFRIELAADNSGVFHGERFTQAQGRHEFRVSPQAARAFRERVAPFRPDGRVSYDHGNCPVPVMSDLPTVRVDWSDGDSLDWYLGCRTPGLSAIEPDLAEAWRELPEVVQLVGRPQR